MRYLQLLVVVVLIPACSNGHQDPIPLLPETLLDASYQNGHALVRNAGLYKGMEQMHVDLLNNYRDAWGLPRFAVSDALGAVGRAYGEHESQGGFFAHQNDEGEYLDGRLYRASGVVMIAVAETLFVGFDPSPINVMDMFIASPPHNAVLHSTVVNTVGVGIYSDGTYYFVSYEFCWR